MFEKVDPRVLGAVRVLGRELRYRPLESLVGRRVVIDSVDRVDRVVRTVVPELGASARLSTSARAMTLTIAKYGLLDLQYDVDSIDAPPVGCRGLGTLGVLDASDGPHDPGPVETILGWLEDVRASSPMLRLMLQGEFPRDAVHDWDARAGWRGELIEEYLPRELTIVDACETNGDFVWLTKHFYL